MGTLSRYIFRKLFLAHIFITCLISSLIWLTQSFRYLRLIVDQKVSFNEFFILAFLLLPGIISYIQPFAFSLGLAYVMNQFKNSRELQAMKTLGIYTNVPLYLGAVLAVMFQIGIHNFLPEAFQKFSYKEKVIKEQLSLDILKPNTFNEVNNNTIFFKNIKNNNVKDVFIYKKSGNKRNIVSAKSATLRQEGDKNVLLLAYGERTEITPKNITKIGFDELEYNMGKITLDIDELQQFVFGSGFFKLLKSKNPLASSEAFMRLLKTVLPIISLSVFILFIGNITFASLIAVLCNGVFMFVVKIIYDITIMYMFFAALAFMVFFAFFRQLRRDA